MDQSGASQRLPDLPVRVVIAAVAAAGALTLVALVPTVEWEPRLAAETGLFTALMVIAGMLPIPVGPRIKAGVTTAPLFATVVLLPAGAAVLAVGLGTLVYQIAWRARPEPELHLPVFKYPFNTGESVLTAGTGVAVWSTTVTFTITWTNKDIRAHGMDELKVSLAPGFTYVTPTYVTPEAVKRVMKASRRGRRRTV